MRVKPLLPSLRAGERESADRKRSIDTPPNGSFFPQPRRMMEQTTTTRPFGCIKCRDLDETCAEAVSRERLRRRRGGDARHAAPLPSTSLPVGASPRVLLPRVRFPASLSHTQTSSSFSSDAVPAVHSARHPEVPTGGIHSITIRDDLGVFATASRVVYRLSSLVVHSSPSYPTADVHRDVAGSLYKVASLPDALVLRSPSTPRNVACIAGRNDDATPHLDG